MDIYIIWTAYRMFINIGYMIWLWLYTDIGVYRIQIKICDSSGVSYVVNG
jgi:hypothetical protein